MPESKEPGELPSTEPVARHPAAMPIDTLLSECSEIRTRGSGPGGQHRNKVETAVVLTHDPTGIRGEASERRSQKANRKRAVFRLRVNLALQTRGDFASLDEPSELWRSRCLRGRIMINPKHDEFPELLAEVLDRVAACRGVIQEAAQQLQTSGSQLIRFLKKEPRALQQINQIRQEQGLGRLR